mmetsp:Transcript_15663/g.39403  ORF Transcript_15663/g.39403 Transcript_15663/m.39403 type:complete len:368 (-) Transcript_15663:1203-2306(-)
MFLNVLVATAQVSDSGSLASRQQPLDNVLGIVRDLGRTRVLDHDNSLEETDLIRPVHVKGGLTHKHLINQNTETPVIDGLVVTLRHDDFGGEVFGCSAQGVCLVNNNLGKTEIHHNTVSIPVNESIFGFHVPVDNVSGVHISEGLENACRVEFRRCVIKAVPGIGMNHIKEFSSLPERQEEIQKVFILEATNQRQDEGMFERCHDLFLSQDSLHLSSIDQLTLRNRLEGVGLLGIAAGRQPNLSKGTHSKHLVLLDIINSKSGIEGLGRERNWLSETLDVTNDGFNVGLLQSPTNGIFLNNAGFLANIFPVGLNSLVSKVISGSQKENLSVLFGDHEPSFLDDPQRRIVTNLSGLGKLLSLFVFSHL